MPREPSGWIEGNLMRADQLSDGHERSMSADQIHRASEQH